MICEHEKDPKGSLASLRINLRQLNWSLRWKSENQIGSRLSFLLECQLTINGGKRASLSLSILFSSIFVESRPHPACLRKTNNLGNNSKGKMVIERAREQRSVVFRAIKRKRNQQNKKLARHITEKMTLIQIIPSKFAGIFGVGLAVDLSRLPWIPRLALQIARPFRTRVHGEDQNFILATDEKNAQAIAFSSLIAHLSTSKNMSWGDGGISE